MKKAAVAVLLLVFAAGMFHYFFGEDHCPAHCLAKGGGFGHVHPHHGGASACLCFWGSLFGPETDDLVRLWSGWILNASPDDGFPLAAVGPDIAHPPKSPLA